MEVKEIMKKIIKTIIICTLLIIPLAQFSNTVFAGDENNPEITDEEQDMFGPWTKTTEDQETYSFLDIVSAWFSEKQNEPDYLLLYLKVKDLAFTELNSIYSMHWHYKDVWYGVGVHTESNGNFQAFFAGNEDKHKWEQVTGEFDLEKNIVFFKVPKLLVGNPKPGDVLTKTEAWSALRLKMELLTLVFGDGELVKDWAGYGKDYTILYESLGYPYMYGIIGSTLMNPNIESPYFFKAKDPEGQNLYYYIDWGDGQIDNWIGPYESDEQITINHTWVNQGSYKIKAKAKDINGYESDWAELSLSVIKVKNKAHTVLLQKILAKYPLIMSIIKALSKRTPMI